MVRRNGAAWRRRKAATTAMRRRRRARGGFELSFGTRCFGEVCFYKNCFLLFLRKKKRWCFFFNSSKINFIFCKKLFVKFTQFDVSDIHSLYFWVNPSIPPKYIYLFYARTFRLTWAIIIRQLMSAQNPIIICIFGLKIGQTLIFDNNFFKKC